MNLDLHDSQDKISNKVLITNASILVEINQRGARISIGAPEDQLKFSHIQWNQYTENAISEP